MTISLTDGGIETALADRLGQELPEFAAFVLLDSAEGRAALRDYYRPFVALASERELPIVLDTPTWRANPVWGDLLGYDAAALDRLNRDAVSLVREVAEEFPGAEVTVNGCVGPRADDYVAEQRMHSDEAAAYHLPQVQALASAGVDRVTSVTTLDPDEGIGVVRAAQATGVPVAVSFTVGAAGRLADGSSLAEAIAIVDAATGGVAEGFLVNCAHPAEVALALDDAPELSRLVGFRLNAARHDDEGAGDEPGVFAAALLALGEDAPGARILGGCCGTDVPHIKALASTARAEP